MEGHIYIDGVIEQDFHMDVKRQLEALKNAESIVLHIQSPGGSVYAGYNTYHVLKSAGKPIKAIIEGECQSIATFISLAADQVVIRNPSVYMIHNPSNEVRGDAQKLEGGASELRNIENDMVAAYIQKTKLPEDKVREMMKNQTTLTAAQAKQMGFVDEVIDPLKAVAMGKKIIKMKDKSIFDNLGNRIAQMFKEVFPSAMALTTTDGKTLNVDSEDGDLVGKPATIDGQPADGTYMLTDGRQIICVAGIVTEVMEANGEEAMKKELEAIKAQIQAMQAENAALKQAKADADAKVVAAEAKHLQGATALKEIEKEFNELKTRTVGDDDPPRGSGKHTVTMGADDWQTKARQELFDQHLPFLKQLNKK